MGCGSSKKHVTEPVQMSPKKDGVISKTMSQAEVIASQDVAVQPESAGNTGNAEHSLQAAVQKVRAVEHFRKTTAARVCQVSIAQDYEMGPIIGSGGYSQIRQATHKSLGVQRAVKVYMKMTFESWMKDNKYITQEAKILSGLDHPNILRVYELYMDERNYYATMEYCAGGELFERLTARKLFRESDCVKIMSQLLSAVAYCHDHRVVHRDIKPENILLLDGGKDLEIKICDFGASAFFDTDQKLAGMFGSIYYIAPEVFDEVYSEKCDVWSCGVIMYMLLCGRSPWHSISSQGLKDAIKSEKLKFEPESIWSRVSDNAKSLIRKLLKRKSKKRISAHQALSHPWITEYHDSATEPNLIGTSCNLLKEFNSMNKLKDAIYSFIAAQVMTHRDTTELRKSFCMIDKNNDGQLCKQELVDEYAKTLGMQEAQNQVEKIMNMVDVDKNGKIEYTEFIAATIQQAKMVSKEQLSKTFAAFDADGNGTISASELKVMLGHEDNPDIGSWEELIEEIDSNGDGEIDIKEFEEMLLHRF